MEKTQNRKILPKTFLLALTLLLLLTLPGCGSVDKDDAELSVNWTQPVVNLFGKPTST